VKPETPLARVPRERLAPDLQRAWDKSQKMHGDATFVEVFGNAPHVLDWYMQEFYAKLFYSGRIDRKIVELVRLRLANIHGCAFCNRSDTIAALDAGVPQAQIDGLSGYESGPFSEREKAVLALAPPATSPRSFTRAFVSISAMVKWWNWASSWRCFAAWPK
jgi:AhpD family alkylhydroperoxidase